MRILADGFVDTSPLTSNGTVEDHILTVWGPMFWISMVVWVGVSGLILFAALRYRRRSDDDEPVQVHGNNKIEVIWTLVPFLVLIGLFALTTVQMSYVRTTPASAMKMCVVGAQFQWTYHYSGVCPEPGKVDKSGVVVQQYITNLTGVHVNHEVAPFVIPANTPVSMDITAADVIHSYYIPTLAGQMNAVPGQMNHFWLDARPGKYYGQCTELCGAGHADMLIEIDALPKAEYDAWYAKQPGAHK